MDSFHFSLTAEYLGDEGLGQGGVSMAFVVQNSGLMNKAQEEIFNLVSQLNNDSDRCLAIVGTAIIESQLRDIARRVTGERASKNERYQTLASRIRWVAQLQLVSNVVRDDLELIKNVRNKFAHSRDFTLDFRDKEVATWTAGLKFARDVPGYSTLSDRCKFEVTVQHIGVELLPLLGAARPIEAGQLLTGMKPRTSAMEDFVDVKSGP